MPSYGSCIWRKHPAIGRLDWNVLWCRPMPWCVNIIIEKPIKQHSSLELAAFRLKWNTRKRHDNGWIQNGFSGSFCVIFFDSSLRLNCFIESNFPWKSNFDYLYFNAVRNIHFSLNLPMAFQCNDDPCWPHIRITNSSDIQMIMFFFFGLSTVQTQSLPNHIITLLFPMTFALCAVPGS